MDSCIESGCRTEGILPGGLDVKRRAAGLYQELTNAGSDVADPLLAIDWVSLFALAVNEENAAGGRVVTAPTQWCCWCYTCCHCLLYAFYRRGR